MNQHEFEYWKAVTDSSACRWVEDSITRLNGKGGLYYTGGENGRYMRVFPDGTLTVGTYEGAYPHIGKAIFRRQAEYQYADAGEAFEAACRLGGKQFLTDIFSTERTPEEETGMGFEMKM